tara:strand:+ start:509 stop:811 length:303 start_codon:yes stop_codon:yes gene_type:complete
MSKSKDDFKPIQKESEKSLGTNNQQDSVFNYQSEVKEISNKENIKESFHLNSLITKNVSLFTKNPNYKMLAWLIVQLIIFSLFIFSVNIFKNNLIPYFNS